MSGKIGLGTGVKSVEWYTPKWIFDILGCQFDLDPASPIDHETDVPALKKYTRDDDGLRSPWFGYVWINPPYGRDMKKWMSKMIDHNNGIALAFSRTDSYWMQESMKRASAVLFLKGRIEFTPGHENKHKKERAGAGTVMIAFGERAKNDLLKLKDYGVFYFRSYT